MEYFTQRKYYSTKILLSGSLFYFSRKKGNYLEHKQIQISGRDET